MLAEADEWCLEKLRRRAFACPLSCQLECSLPVLEYLRSLLLFLTNAEHERHQWRLKCLDFFHSGGDLEFPAAGFCLTPTLAVVGI